MAAALAEQRTFTRRRHAVRATHVWFRWKAAAAPPGTKRIAQACSTHGRSSIDVNSRDLPSGEPTTPMRASGKMSTGTSNFVRRGVQPRAHRSTVSMSAAMTTMSAYHFPELTDISANGAKLRGSPLPPKGTVGLLRSGALEMLCRVVWSHDGECGVQFDEPLPMRLLRQIRTEDEVALELRR